ncbi:alternate-type signal peptide domain-containing protein [Arthrobacter sp. Sa2CUA1]|uniref:Alternate-type signal peptide domain-containing protein n=1 Tax=Arthrobacter gallicola TaxID=2762225 RepID=A0ABR8UU55_9MICC|nr:alternate-type signal peptide domain-containing protein [Arthrobacter gallicola]MBD7996058.1 alternate-type signal peptide domain-containing protein [Arthrobacter gallicola]
MNKMAKGALATGVGVALLLGGGGTLAVWNQTANADAGTIASGDLNLVGEEGFWTSSVSGKIADISKYTVVPGETLTYTQNLDVTLVGDNLSADLTVTGDSVNGLEGADLFDPKNVTVSGVSLKKGGKDVDTTLTESVEDIEASISFVFEADLRESTNAKYDFRAIGFELEQNVPTAATPAP